MAEHFIRLYWRQARPYVPRGNPVEDAGGPLIAAETASSYGTNSAVLRQRQGSLAELPRDPTTWSRLVKSVAITIEEMPLWKLQTIGDSDDEFLYDNHRGAKVTSIQLKAGVAFTLRRFHPFIEELVRGGWARFVAGFSQKKATLGEAEDLTAFLFGTERASLEPYVPILLELQDGVCFYCQASLVRKTGHVDHFIPWARYPVDLAHNFVLAHDACNKDKSNVLAACDHLERWTVRNRDHAKTLESEFATNKLFHDLDASRAITRWAYTIAEQSQSKVCGCRGHLASSISTRGGARFPTFDAALRGSGSVLGTETNWFGKPSLAGAPSSGILVLWPTRGSRSKWSARRMVAGSPRCRASPA